MSKKKNPKYLTAEQRPLFAPVHAVHKTKKDKLNSRQNRKLEVKKYEKEIY